MFGKRRQTKHLPDLVSTQEHFSSSLTALELSTTTLDSTIFRGDSPGPA